MAFFQILGAIGQIGWGILDPPLDVLYNNLFSQLLSR